MITLDGRGRDMFLNIPNKGIPGDTVGKESPCNAGDTGSICRLGSQAEKIPWRRAWQPTPEFLPGPSHGQRSLAGCGPQGRIETDTSEVTVHAHVHTE